MPLAQLTVDEANTIKQTAQADVYAQVETDLKEAARILPDSYDAEEYGRLTMVRLSIVVSFVFGSGPMGRCR